VAVSYAEEPAAPSASAPSVQPTARFQETFSAQRFSEAYDRAARKGAAKPVDSAAVVSSTSLDLAPLLSKMVFSLLVIVGVIYAVSYAARRWSGGTLLPTMGPLKVLARQPLSSKSSVYVVAAMDRLLIIGESSQGLTCLSQFEDTEENRRLRETWGWEGAGAKEKNRLYYPKTSPFGPSLRSHVEDLERELSKFQEVS
jgi:flagellar biogenesis protein FliO